MTHSQEDPVLGPWTATNWCLDITLLPHIKQLIVTTPTYIVWPPTARQFDSAKNKWTAQLRRSPGVSVLQEIVIHSAFADEGDRIRSWEETGGELPDVLDGRNLGADWVWRRESRKEWQMVSHTAYFSNREEYFFGRSEGEYELGWLHIDAEAHGRGWRRSMRKEQFYCPPFKHMQ